MDKQGSGRIALRNSGADPCRKVARTPSVVGAKAHGALSQTPRGIKPDESAGVNLQTLRELGNYTFGCYSLPEPVVWVEV